MKYLTR